MNGGFSVDRGLEGLCDGGVNMWIEGWKVCVMEGSRVDERVLMSRLEDLHG